jgi:hypothetical protein
MEYNKESAENERWNDIEENTNTHTTGSEDTDLDRGPEYVARLQAGLEETLSKPRRGTHVTDLVLCSRLRVFREIDPLPIDAKTLAIFATGMAFHRVYQWLLLRDSRRFEREKHLEFRGIMGRFMIFFRKRVHGIFRNYDIVFPDERPI